MRSLASSNMSIFLTLIVGVIATITSDKTPSPSSSSELLLSPQSGDNELEEHCKINSFGNVGRGLRFTKEIVTTEYANAGSFKALHCCLRGYRSIEWYKDDKAYPWPRAVSNFIIYPESKNQTIYTQVAGPEDAGRFSCRARNDTNMLTGDISLEIIGELSRGEIKMGYTGKPLPTYRPMSQVVPLGGSARLFCEAYLGRVDLPDVENSVTWSKAGSNITITSEGRVRQIQVSREVDQVVGSYLEINATILGDYDRYECRISNGADEEIVLSAYIYQREEIPRRGESPEKSFLLGLGLLGFGITVLIIYHTGYLPIAVLLRNRFSDLEENDGKIYDALICYHGKDSALAINELRSKMETKYKFQCKSLEITHLHCNWLLEISPHSRKARRVIILLSTNSLNNSWTKTTIMSAIKQLSSLVTKTIVLCLDDLPAEVTLKKMTGSLIIPSSVNHFNIANVDMLRWRHEDVHSSEIFWWKLRLLLPAKRSGYQVKSLVDAGAQEMTPANQQQNAQSRHTASTLV